jgi:peptide/nickel transport system substrate-binding protein
VPDRIDRRTFLINTTKLAGLGAVALSGGALLSACGSKSSSSSAPATTAKSSHTVVSAGKPKYGGNLKIGTWTDETTLLYLQGTWDGVGYDYGMAMFDPLMVTAPDGSLLPYLAQSVTHNPDYTKWTITLRPNITYTDGSPLDAANLVANFKAYLASPDLGYIFAPIKSVAASGSYGAVITMSDPWVPFDAYLTGFWPQATSTLPAKYKGNPVGTGPFTYQAWEPGSHLYLTRNPKYWRKGLPYLDQVSFLPMLNSQQKENALKAGDINMALVGNTIDDLSGIVTNSGLQYVDDAGINGPETDMVYWLLNCAVAPTNDVRVRNALAYATDQSLFWKEVFIGSGAVGGPSSSTPVTGPFQPGSPYYELDTGYPQKQDTAKAKALIAEYAKEHGTPKITLTASTEVKELTALQLTQSMWQEAGVDVTIQQLDVGTLIVRGLKGQTQAVYWDYGTAIDPDQNFPAWSPLYSASIGTIALEETRLKDPRIEPLLVTGRTSGDQATRVAAYQSLAKVFGELTPFIYMGRGLGGLAATKNVQNLESLTTPDGTKIMWAQAGTFATELWLS